MTFENLSVMRDGHCLVYVPCLKYIDHCLTLIVAVVVAAVVVVCSVWPLCLCTQSECVFWVHLSSGIKCKYCVCEWMAKKEFVRTSESIFNMSRIIF